MARVEELDALLLVDDLGGLRVHVDRELRHRLNGVELPEDRGELRDRVRALAGPPRQIAQDAHDLGPLLVLQRDDVVVELDGGQGLDEEARARAGAAVDDPRQLALLLRLEQQNVAVVAHRDDPVLQQPLRVAAAQVPFHHGRELRLQAQERPAHVGELRRRVVRHLARGQQRATHGGRDVGRVLGFRRQPGEAGCVLGPGDPARDLDAAFDEGREVGERPRLEVRAARPRHGQGRGGVGQVVVGLAAEGPQERHTLARPDEGGADGARIGAGLEARQAGEALRRAGLLQQQRTDLVELESGQRVSVHAGRVGGTGFRFPAGSASPGGRLPRTAEALKRVSSGVAAGQDR